MGKPSKRTVKFLRKQAKEGSHPAKSSFRKKRPRQSDEDDLEVVDVGVEKPIQLRTNTESISKSKKESVGSVKK
jgi:hypothetical protein